MRAPGLLLLIITLALFPPSAAIADDGGHSHEGHSHSRAVLPDYGARGALSDLSLTLPKALTYALQEEYLSRARHAAAMARFGIRRPFSLAQMAQENHIRVLRGLVRQHGVTLPPDLAAALVTPPRSLKVAYQVAYKGEVEKGAMYEKLSNLPDLPDEVRRMMQDLAGDCRQHLESFRMGLLRLD